MQHTGGPIGAAERQAVILPMSCLSAEPTLADLFNDPITHSMMAADHVDHGDLLALLQRAQHFVCYPVGRNRAVK